MTSFLLLSFISLQLKAETEKSIAPTVAVKPVESTNNNALAVKTIESADVNSNEAAISAETAIANSQLARLEEIKAMDKSELTASEKNELRQEVRVIQRDRDRRNHGDYDGPRRHGGEVFIFGGGAVLLLILLLLILSGVI